MASVLAVALAGYAGAYRLGRWLDEPGTATETDQDDRPSRSRESEPGTASD
ncbi:hypothetical protein GCM10010470_24590 [Saccharopolyspora taberi]|uniref:Uncharacterized protein n=1 Tax=Saccharopolyspora taberi TaxID=60895 RepID=A0ABN3VBF7_9PSEU